MDKSGGKSYLLTTVDPSYAFTGLSVDKRSFYIGVWVY